MRTRQGIKETITGKLIREGGLIDKPLELAESIVTFLENEQNFIVPESDVDYRRILLAEFIEYCNKNNKGVFRNSNQVTINGFIKTKY